MKRVPDLITDSDVENYFKNRRREPGEFDVSKLVSHALARDDRRLYVSHNEMLAILDAGGAKRYLCRQEGGSIARYTIFQEASFVHVCMDPDTLQSEDVCHHAGTRKLFETDD